MFGKAPVADIQFLGTSEDVVWRSPETDFMTGAKLTVNEAQEALFYFNGACVGMLGAGDHILETENIPFLRRIIQKITGNKTIFHAQVYFVNKVLLDLKWGVGDIVYTDPLGPVFSIGARGQMMLQASQTRKIVEKLCGMEPSLTRTALERRFKNLVGVEVADLLVNTILDNQISIVNISRYLRKTSDLLGPVMQELFDKFGFEVEHFRILGVNVPEDDPAYLRLKRLMADRGLVKSEIEVETVRFQFEQDKKRAEAETQAHIRQVQGYDYATEQSFKVMNTVAQSDNSAASGLMSDMMKMGVGFGAMKAMSGSMQGLATPLMEPLAPAAPAPQPQQPKEDPVAVLMQLKELLDLGAIKQSDYDAKKNEILSRM